MLALYLSLLETQEDQDKFAALYQQYGPLLKQIAYQKLQDEQLAEDAVHTAFLNIIKSFCEIDEKNCHKTRRFLVIVTENVATDMLRKRRRTTRVDIPVVEAALAANPDMLERVAVQELARKIAALPENYRVPLELRAYHGLSEKQIATVLNISYEAVRKRLERARKLLAAAIRKQEKEGESYETVSK